MIVNHHRAYLPSERRSVTLFHALVVDKTTEMYCELFQDYFTAAKEAGLRSPTDYASTTAALHAAHETAAVAFGHSQRGNQVSVVLLDFELAEHKRLFKALANVFCYIHLRYHGRVLGCRVHLRRFLLPKWRGLGDENVQRAPAAGMRLLWERRMCASSSPCHHGRVSRWPHPHPRRLVVREGRGVRGSVVGAGGDGGRDRPYLSASPRGDSGVSRQRAGSSMK